MSEAIQTSGKTEEGMPENCPLVRTNNTVRVLGMQVKRGCDITVAEVSANTNIAINRGCASVPPPPHRTRPQNETHICHDFNDLNYTLNCRCGQNLLDKSRTVFPAW